ncbi:MAG: tryptophan synthase subunit alpha [Odoribacteraceae bacterium]|jgi:tryptophan synthase alpha chain|nr:tryptophan synthase subunit alpha [Odoribacteraceae bacterium]
MNKINTLFREKHQNVLSVYFTAGFPGPDDTLPVIRALANAGVDMIEIGVPFSDPVADGPVIQQSGTAALRGGMTLEKLFAQLSAATDKPRVPLVLMTYLNPLLRYGFQEACRSCVEAGISGLIVPDLPPRAFWSDYRHFTRYHDLNMILLVAPGTSPSRFRAIDALSGGFIYMVSSASVTGTRDNFSQETIDYFRYINSLPSRNPLMIGFGVSNKATFDTACQHAAGVIIGSKFVSLLGQTDTPREAVNQLFRSIYY